VEEMNEKFAVFILSHGRAGNVKTYQTLIDQGYTGKIYIIVDDEDDMQQSYVDRYGTDVVRIFSKQAASVLVDPADLEPKLKGVIYARNYCHTIAAELLQYDTLVSYRGKVRSEAVGLPKQTKELLQVGEAFWRNEEIASTFIPNYTFKEWRKIRQQYVEMTMSRETATYLGIQHIPEGDFTVIIDVNKEVTPFIRPENIQ